MSKFQKGHAKVGGRKPGSRNKATLMRSDILAMMLGALQAVGGQKAFEEWAKDRRGKREFLKAVIGLIPKEDKVDSCPTVNFIIEQPALPKITS